MNPGPAISIRRTRPCGSCTVATSRSATARGFCLSALVVGDVEAGALEHQSGAARDLPLRHLATGGALHAAMVVHRRVELLEHMPGRAFELVGRHRTTT